jgi:hypothetical protein
MVFYFEPYFRPDYCYSWGTAYGGGLLGYGSAHEGFVQKPGSRGIVSGSIYGPYGNKGAYCPSAYAVW